ncbi:N-acetyltransferase [Cytophagales bacterium RKSG123]|nr:N-acetyltransferase [Xanthovirga aplysinae]
MNSLLPKERNMIFETERLVIRKLRSVDLLLFHDMQGNPNVMKYVKNPMSITESEKELNRFINYYTSDGMLYNIWAIESAVDREFIGICGVYENDKSEREIAYRLRERHWGKGFGREIVSGLINFLFEERKIEEVVAYVNRLNLGSVSILEKEMEFVEEFYSEKEKCTERKYQFSKEN